MTSPLITPDILNALAQQKAATAALPAPSLAPAMGMQTPMPTLNAPALPNVVPQAGAFSAPNAPAIHQSNLDHLTTTGSGIDQIQNPLLRGIARTADVIGSLWGPTRLLEMGIPGTNLHHQMLVNQAQQQVVNDQNRAQKDAEAANLQATTDHTNAATNALENPLDKFSPIQTDSGYAAFDPSTGEAKPITGPDGQQLASPDKTKPLSIEEQAYNFAVKAGKNPLDAYAAVYGAKNTKTDNLPEQYLEAMQNGDATKANLIRKTIHDTSTQPKIDIHQATAAPSGVPGVPSGGGVSPMIQAIIDGRAPAPNSRSKAGMAIMAQVTAADPTYDASRYNTYQAMQREMTSGKTGQAINSLNTIQEHLARAERNLPSNSGIPLMNTITNATSTAMGGNPTGKFDVDATGIAGEWAKLVAGGVASEGEQKHVQALLNHNGSPQQMRDNLAEVKAMTDGKLAGIQKQVASAVHPGTGSNMPTSLPGNLEGSAPAHSLATAMALPFNRGKSADEVRQDLLSHGYKVIP